MMSDRVKSLLSIAIRESQINEIISQCVIVMACLSIYKLTSEENRLLFRWENSSVQFYIHLSVTALLRASYIVLSFLWVHMRLIQLSAPSHAYWWQRLDFLTVKYIATTFLAVCPS